MKDIVDCIRCSFFILFWHQVRVESFVSRDILDKTMGSNVPVLRHLAEEAAQQKSRHVALVYGEDSGHATSISAEQERSERVVGACLLDVCFRLFCAPNISCRILVA